MTTTVTRQLLRITTAGSVDDGKSTLIGRLPRHGRQPANGSPGEPSPTKKALPTSPPCPTVCAPSANRASPSTSRTGSSQPRPAATSSPTPRATSATPATCSPARQRPRRDPACRRPRQGASADLPACPDHQLLGIKHFVATVNKIDLVDFDKDRFTEVEDQLRQVAARLGSVDLTVIPIAAKHGDNVVQRSGRLPGIEAHSAGVPGERRAVGPAAGGLEATAAGAVGIAAHRRRAAAAIPTSCRQARCRSAIRW